MANEFKVRKGLIVQGSGSNIFDVQGSQGQLFSVTDSLSGSLFSVNDISGIPIMEVFSDNTIKMGTFNQEAIIISGSRTGMGTALPQAELHISGANNDSLFRIQSPASASIMFVSGSGNVGIGTATPTQKISIDNGNVGFTSGFGVSWDSDTEWIKRAAASDQLQIATQNTVRLNIGSTQGQLVAIGLGTTAASAQFQVRGGGATAASTAMRIEDSGGNARLTILDDGTSAFNTSHLYVSSSGRIGIGTATPTIGVLDINGIGRIRSSNQLYFGGTGAGDWQGAISGQASGLLVNANLVTINNSGYASPATQSFVINTSQNVAVGPHSPTARLHVSGASNTVLFEIDSPAQSNIIYVSGSGNVGIGTGTPTNTLQVVGGVTATSITASIISASSGITGSLFGTASVAVTAQTASFLPIGTYSITSSWAQSASNAVNAQTASFITSTATNAFIQGGNSFGATALLGTNDTNNLELETGGTTRVFISSSGRVGIGTSSPTERLHVDGNMIVTGRITAEEFHTEFVSASIIYQSGSTQFGNSSDDTHIFTGSLRVNGSITGSLLGTASVAVTAQTASFLPTGTYSITSSWATNALTASFVNTTNTNAFVQNGNSFGATALLGTNDNQNLQFETSGSVRMTISSSGNVGIGTTSPITKLHVSGNIYTEDNLIIPSGKDILIRDVVDDTTGTIIRGTYDRSETDPGFDYISTSSIFLAGLTNTRIDLFGTNTTYVGGLPNFGRMLFTIPNSGNALFSSPSNANILFVSGSGNIGVGTTTPDVTLDVVGQIRASSTMFNSTTQTNTIQLNSATNLRFFSASVETARYDSNGWGFFNNAPAAKVHISGANADALFRVSSPSAPSALFVSGSGRVGIGTGTPRAALHVSAGDISLDGTRHLDWANGDNRIIGGSAGGYSLQFHTWTGAALTEKMRISGSGEVGIGVTNMTARLHVSGASNAGLFEIDSPAVNNIIYVSGSGNVGIGTNTPTVPLQVAGIISSSGNITTQGEVRNTNELANDTTFIRTFGGNNDYTALRLSNAPNMDLGSFGFSIKYMGSRAGDANSLSIFADNQSAVSQIEALTIFQDGKIGIGNAAPTQKLDVRDGFIQVSGSDAAGQGITIARAGFDTYQLTHEDGGLTIRNFTDNVKEMTFLGNGNIGINKTNPSAKLEIRGAGATSATTALRVENSNQDPELTVLDNGNVGISTATPSDLLTINSPSSTGSLRLTHSTEIETLRATSFHSGLYIGNNIYYNGSGDPATNSLYALDSGSNNRGGNLLLMRANNGTTSLGGFYFYTARSSSIENTTATLTENLRILPSASVFSNTRVGIGATPNTSYAFDIQSSAPNAGAARINGNNTVWLFNDLAQVSRGTTSISRMVTMTMGPITATSSIQSALVISQSINQSSTAGYTALVVNANETATGSGNKLLQSWQFNGTNQTVINNSGSIGVGIDTPSASLHISGASNSNLLRIQSPASSSILFVTGSGRVGIGTDTPSQLFEVVTSGATKIIAGTNVGIQTGSASEWIHLSSDPASGKFIRIDATQGGNPPLMTSGQPAPNISVGSTGNPAVYLSEPDYWMEIKLGAAGGGIVLIPCYLPE